MSSGEPVNVRVLDREYTVGVAPGEREALVAAARLLDTRMRELRGSNRMAAIDRIAVLAALNLAAELQLLRSEHDARDRELRQAMAVIERRLDAVD
ncbi:cell division protein ZapA [Luteimonas yindakuii]|uniref:Cell division protein ZapA n=1 Tax=Luteimonas yindakuii TaxID=2565782 RepID=A0A4Z1R1D0_9GAMM|nr:cell division protein ZapA [Luteimonas yindakuii]QCO67140.1 cell division protein ZapA [Luteimonas yindakuii]TKS53312.1 cell division protein ZapA [Luteimonas yindakuii]